MKAQRAGTRRTVRISRTHRVSGAAASRRRYSGNLKSKKNTSHLLIALFLLAALSAILLILQKPESSPSEVETYLREQKLLEQLKQENPDSEVFRLEGGN